MAEGIDGLSKPKGRPTMSEKKKKLNKNNETLIKKQSNSSFKDKYFEPTAGIESRIIHELQVEFKLAVIHEAIGFQKQRICIGKSDLTK